MQTDIDKNTATIRTGINSGVFAAIAALVFKLTGKTLTTDDLLPWIPVLAVAIGVLHALFYRLSLVVVEKFPTIGFVLFGKRTPPTFPAPPPAAG